MPKGTRPSQNVVRKAIFDIIGQDMAGVEFLELFAGSGAVSLEAFSRGADRITLVEKDSRCTSVIRDNLALFNINNNIEIINSDVFRTIKLLEGKKRKFDVVFFDPPYGQDLGKKALKTLMAYDILRPDSIIIVEHSKRENLPDEDKGRFLLVKQRKYGSSLLSIYKKG